MIPLSLVYPFYKNPGMLAHQFSVWAAYPESLKAQIEIVVVDDGSPEDDAASAVARPEGLPPFRLYRVLEDRPWHQHGARNLGAHVALGYWLFMSDMDHVLPADSLERLLQALHRTGVVFTFSRLDAPDLTPKMLHGRRHPHPNTFAITRERFWAIGGYDEDCQGYGTDWVFRRHLHPVDHLEFAPVIRYPREVIADASTRAEGDPKAFRDAARQTETVKRLVAQKDAQGVPPKVLDFPWAQVV